MQALRRTEAFVNIVAGTVVTRTNVRLLFTILESVRYVSSMNGHRYAVTCQCYEVRLYELSNVKLFRYVWRFFRISTNTSRVPEATRHTVACGTHVTLRTP